MILSVNRIQLQWFKIFFKEGRNTYRGLNSAKGKDEELSVLRDQEEKAIDTLSSNGLRGENNVLEIQ